MCLIMVNINAAIVYDIYVNPAFTLLYCLNYLPLFLQIITIYASKTSIKIKEIILKIK